jgi:two-component system sensor histidine kinase KdpD
LRARLEALTSLTAMAMERLQYGEILKKSLLASESERFRYSLLSAISHDLRTPLGVLAGMADSLTRAKPTLPPRETEIAESIRNQSRRMSNLVNDLLDLMRANVSGIHL